MGDATGVETSNVDDNFQPSLSKSRHRDARVPNRVSCGIANHAARAAKCRTKCRNIFICEINKVFKQNSLSSRVNNVGCGRDGKADAKKAGSECDADPCWRLLAFSGLLKGLHW